MFPDDAAATRWFEATRWADGRCCPKCGSVRTAEIPSRKPMPYRCKDCRGHFSVRTGTVMRSSKLGLQKWAFGIYLLSTSPKGVSSMKLHRDLGITQKPAWMMGQKIREGWIDGSGPLGRHVPQDERQASGARTGSQIAAVEGVDCMSQPKKKRGRGRPPKWIIQPIPATPEEIARALFRAAERKREKVDGDPGGQPV